MLDYLKPADGPVIDFLESAEVVYAKEQPQYLPLRALKGPIERTNGAVLTRWALTEEQRQKVYGGEDIFLELLTFGGPLQPIRMSVGPAGVEDFQEGGSLRHWRVPKKSFQEKLDDFKETFIESFYSQSKGEEK